MTFDADDDILQDFLLEAGEILEQLGEQLVELEQRPQDADLLNAVFRAFHTVKGGAGFLNLTALVAICHRSEDVFNVLRQGERVADADLMDAILQSLDVVNGMFDEVRGGEEPTPADPALIERLESLAQPGGGPADGPASAPPPEPPPATEPSAAPASDEITDDEFEALLDAMEQQKKEGGAPAEPPKPAEPAKAGPASDEITEDEFEAMLDQLHGQGHAPGAGSTPPASPPPEAAKPQAKPSAPAPGAGAQVAAKPATETSVRVDTKRLDDIMNLVGELVLVRNRLATLRTRIQDEEVTQAVANLDLVTADLQGAVMKTRMQPVKKVFGRFPRVVRDLARSLDKQIRLDMRGEETDLDKNLVEALADPLVHLVRNAVDHGIESPAERESKGKPREGQVVLAAEQEGDHILLSISDDGKGMDPGVLRRKAVEKKMMDEEAAERLSDNEAFNLIFAAGFSTRTEISDVSGRGVGMDVVKTGIAKLNGSIQIHSKSGEGSVIEIKVPLTLAILPTLMVVLGNQRFALPLTSVSEIFNLDLSRTSVVDGQEVVVVRGHPLPLFHLRRWLVRDAFDETPPDQGHVVVVNVANKQVGFVVDKLIGQEEVVIKPLGASLQGQPGLAGATITGDGRIALILDVPSLMKAYVNRF